MHLRQCSRGWLCAGAEITNHNWMKNSLKCAFDRLFLEGNVSTTDERWKNAHIINRYRIDYYPLLLP
jgi:hypothetical protein